MAALTPQLGQPDGNGDAYRRWEQRMRPQCRRVTTLSAARPHARRLPLLTVVEFLLDTTTTTAAIARITEATKHAPSRNYLRNTGRGDYQQGSPHNNGNTAPLQRGQDARNTGTAPQYLAVYQPNRWNASGPRLGRWHPWRAPRRFEQRQPQCLPAGFFFAPADRPRAVPPSS